VRKGSVVTCLIMDSIYILSAPYEYNTSFFNYRFDKMLSGYQIQHHGPEPHLLQHPPQPLLLGDDQLPLNQDSLSFSPQLGFHLQKTVLAVQRLRVEHSRVMEMSSKLVQERLDLEQHLEDMQATHQTKMEQMSSRWSSCQVLGQLSFRMLRY
jgi:hypothetical protein